MIFIHGVSYSMVLYNNTYIKIHIYKFEFYTIIINGQGLKSYGYFK